MCAQYYSRKIGERGCTSYSYSSGIARRAHEALRRPGSLQPGGACGSSVSTCPGHGIQLTCENHHHPRPRPSRQHPHSRRNGLGGGNSHCLKMRNQAEKSRDLHLVVSSRALGEIRSGVMPLCGDLPSPIGVLLGLWTRRLDQASPSSWPTGLMTAPRLPGSVSR